MSCESFNDSIAVPGSMAVSPKTMRASKKATEKAEDIVGSNRPIPRLLAVADRRSWH